MPVEQYLALDEATDGKYEYLHGYSVQEYLLIGSERKEIIIHRRETDWRPYHYRSGDLVELRSLGISVPFEDFYHKVKL
jgi:Uma2 family endonuclease